MIKCDTRARQLCPFKNQCCGEETAYFVDGSECDKFNQDALATPPTNADRIRAMSDDALADFISRIAYGMETPWSKPFLETFCHSCPAPEYALDDGRKMKLHECDFTDGECPHGGDILWWIEQPAEEDEHA